MLKEMRDNLRHLKWILWLVAFAMVFYLGSFFTGDGRGGAPSGDWVASVNGTKISLGAFQTAARNIDAYYRQLFGGSYDQFRGQIRVGSQAAETLIEQEVILQEARRLGLIATRDELAEQIRTDPSFQDASGKFIGTERYRQLVSGGFGGPAAFEKLVSDEIVIQKWNDLVAQSVSVTDAELEGIHRQRTEKTAIEYVVVRAEDQELPGDPSADELQRWYDEHPDLYVRAEGREVRYVVVSREAQTAQIQITDEEVRASYESNQSNYAHPAQRRASQILLRVEPGVSDADKQAIRDAAEQLLARVESGEEFAALARTSSQDPISAANGGDLQFFAQGQMFPALDSAVFSTPVGQLAALVESEFGFHVVKVTDERPAGVLPLADVEQAIRRSLGLRKAQERLASESQRLREALISASSIESFAEQEGLELGTLFVSAGDRLTELGAGPDFVDSVMALGNGEVSPPLRVAAGMALVRVGDLVAESRLPVEEVASDVRADLLDDSRLVRARSRARSALDDDRDFQAVVAALGLEPRESGDLAPGQEIPGFGGGSAEFAESLFGDAVQVGDSGSIDLPDGALVYQVSRREPFTIASFQEAIPELRREVTQQRQTLWRQTVVGRLKESQEILRNTAVIARADGLDG